MGGFFDNWVDILIVATSGVAAASFRFLLLKETLQVKDRRKSNHKRFFGKLSRDISLLLVALLVFNFASGLGQPFYAIFSTDMLHLSKWELGMMVGLAYLAGMFGAFLAGKVSARLGVANMMAMAIIVASFLLIPWLFSPNPLLAVLVFSVSGFFAQFFYVGNQALMADLTYAKERGSVIGLVTTVAGFGSIIGPYAGSQLWVLVDPRSPFIVSSILSIAIAVPLLMIRKRPNKANCPHCGRRNPLEAKFCDRCGEQMVYQTCPDCGRRLERGAHYCDSCGTGQNEGAIERQ